MATESSFLFVVILDFFMLTKPGRSSSSDLRRASKFTPTCHHKIIHFIDISRINYSELEHRSGLSVFLTFVYVNLNLEALP
jgi:hypothetical protein